MRREKEGLGVCQKSEDEQGRMMNLALHEANSMFHNVGLGRGSVEFRKGNGGEMLGHWERGWQ